MKSFFALIVTIALVLCAGAAVASEYTVQKGDTLSGIAKRFMGSASRAAYMSLAEKNGIENPHLIHPGQKLDIPEGFSFSESYRLQGQIGVISSAPAKPQSSRQSAEKKQEGVFYYRYPARDPYRGTLEKALELLGYPIEVRKAFVEKVRTTPKNKIVHIELRKGDRIAAMTFGKAKVKRNVIAAWDDQYHLYAARLYETEFEGKVYRLIYPLVCGNWSRLEERPIPAPPEVPYIEPPVPQPVPTAPEAPPYIEEEKPCPIEHEPIVGIGTWGNGIAEGDFAYAEYMQWRKKCLFDCSSEYSWGLGAYGSWEQGESELSSYEWDGHTVGPQAGLKYSGLYFDKEDKKYRLQQWTSKVRLVWEKTEGDNDTSGYHMTQDNLKLGAYVEGVKEFDDKWMGIITAEGWIGLDESIKSTWSGDTPSDRGNVQLGVYGQYKINEDWSTRFGGGPFWQQWDDMYGMHLRAEARWKNTVMFGPYANLFPFGKSSAYKGIPTSDLQTWGAFARVEFGEIIRQQDRKIRMQRVKAEDDERFGVIDADESKQL